MVSPVTVTTVTTVYLIIPITSSTNPIAESIPSVIVRAESIPLSSEDTESSLAKRDPVSMASEDTLATARVVTILVVTAVRDAATAVASLSPSLPPLLSWYRW